MPSWLSSTTPASLRLDAALAGFVGLTAFAVRMLVATNVPDSTLIFDMQEYWERGVYIFEHGRLYESSWRTPGYPIALAISFALSSGPSLGAARWLNVFAGTLSALLTYWLARRTGAPRPAFLAALVVALYPSFVLYTAFVATETSVTAPLLATLIATSYGTARSAAAAGSLAAVTALVRPAGIALLPVVLISLFRQGKSASSGNANRSTLVPLACAMTTFVLTMTPWWLHNARAHGRFIPTDTAFGITFFIGNGPLATGLWKSNVFAHLQTTTLKDVDWSTPHGSDQLIAMTLAHVREHPLDTLRILPAKVMGLLALEGREHAYLYSTSYFGPVRPAIVWLWGISTLIAFPLLFVAAMAGSVVTGGVAPRVAVPCAMFLATTLAMHLILFGDSRYHLPMVPVLAVLSTGLARWRNGSPRWALVAAALVLIWLFTAWVSQWSLFMGVLPKLAAPDGWHAQLDYNDLV